jgi:hypothetical protein
MPIVLFISFAVFLGLYINSPLADPDLWWHVVVGRWILSNLDLPTQDIWTQFGSNREWLAYSWSNEVIYALFDKYLGINGLFYLQATLAVLFSISICFVLGKLAKDYLFGALIGALVVIAAHDHFSLRPQAFVWILFSSLLLLSDHIYLKGLKVKSALGLILIFCFWANTHISTLIGLFSCLMWLLPASHIKYSDLKKLFLVLLLCLLGTILTPYLGREWLIFFSKTGHPFQFSSIQEFSPATILDVSTVVIFLMLCLAFCFWRLKVSAVPLNQIILSVAMLLGALIVIKFAPLALIVVAAILAKQWSQVSSDRSGVVEGISRLCTLIRRIPKEGLAFVLLALAYLNFNQAAQTKINYVALPEAAADFIISQNLDGPLMNTFGDGGYLMYRLSSEKGEPNIKVSIDGRTNLISPEIWNEYQRATNGYWGWQAYLERIKPEIIVWRADSALVRILEQSQDWCSVIANKSSPGSSVLMLKKEKVASMQEQGLDFKCL